MFEQALPGKTKQIFLALSLDKTISNFYLAGGTGLALQIGHRESVDLDFFSKDWIINSTLMLANYKDLSPKVIYEDSTTLDVILGGVKVSFLKYGYPTLLPFEFDHNLKIASVLDIACMKLSAISGRGSKKDFVDMYFLLELFPLERIFLAFEEKYRGVEYSLEHLKKSLTYFSEAENQPMPKMLIPADWVKIKDRIVLEVMKL